MGQYKQGDRVEIHRPGGVSREFFILAVIPHPDIPNLECYRLLNMKGGANEPFLFSAAEFDNMTMTRGAITEKLQEKLGSANVKNIEILDDGSIKILVPNTFSRLQLADASVITVMVEPHSLWRSAHDAEHANIIIRRDQLSPGFRLPAELLSFAPPDNQQPLERVENLPTPCQPS